MLKQNNVLLEDKSQITIPLEVCLMDVPGRKIEFSGDLMTKVLVHEVALKSSSCNTRSPPMVCLFCVYIEVYLNTYQTKFFSKLLSTNEKLPESHCTPTLS